MSQISISVRFLVEFVLRAGSLTGGFASRSRAQDGTKGHIRLQKSRPDDYEAEVPVSYQISRDGLDIDISGRMDGFTRVDDKPLIEEIKTITGKFDPSPPDNLLHWAQAKIYAAIITQQQELPQADIKLTYVRLDPWEVHEDVRTFSQNDLATFFDDLLVKFLKWNRPYYDWAEKRSVPSISHLTNIVKGNDAWPLLHTERSNQNAIYTPRHLLASVKPSLSYSQLSRHLRKGMLKKYST
jgi:DNA excision repair protein ERCC-2